MCIILCFLSCEIFFMFPVHEQAEYLEKSETAMGNENKPLMVIS